jgi:hypothetical protein
MIRNLIQRGDTQNRLTRALNIKERVAAPTLGDEVHPVIIVDDLSRETGFDLGTELPAWGRASAGPAAGQLSHIALGNNPSSGAFIQIRRLRFNSTPANNIRLGFVDWGLTGGLGSVTTRTFRDTRLTGLPTGEILAGQLAAGLITNVVQRYGPVTLYDILDMDILLAPGFTLVVQQETVNNTLDCNWWWVEQYINR